MEQELVRLNIIGITYNQIENGMYAMILEEDGGKLRLPIIIGYNEAQAIECMLQKISTPRPLTHEFIYKILEAAGIRIEAVVIKQLPNGIFTADVTFAKGQESFTIDARSSDAIAIAMRGESPIFTTRELLKKCGVERDASIPSGNHFISNQSIPVRQALERVKKPAGNQWSSASDLDLEVQMQKAVDDEDYEMAEEIKKEIERRQGGNL